MPVKPGLIPNMGDVSQATRVQLATLSGGRSRGRSNGGRRRGKKRLRGLSTTRRGTKRAKRSKRSGGSAGRLKKGSPAAKAWGRRMRAKRRRR